MSAGEVVGQALTVVGALVFVVAAVGLHRLPDPYGRISSVGTAGGIGVACVTVGAALVDARPTTIVVVAVAVLLQLVTSAVGAVAIARAAVGSDHPFSHDTSTGELTASPGKE